jgi:hypothetical protein
MSDPDAPKPIIRTADIATPLSGMITSAIQFSYEHRTRFGDDPAADSRAHLEFTTDTGSFSAHRRRDIEAAHESAAGIYILSAAYLLTGLARLLYSEMQLFAYQVVARSVVECAAKAWWLDDAEASMDERLARFYIDRLHNIEEMAGAERLPKAELATKREELVKRAARSGIDPKFDKNNKLIGFGGTVKIGSTRLAGRFFTALGYEDGDLWYRRFSAVVHATPYGLLDYYQMTDVPGSELKELRPSLSIEEVRLAAIVSTQAYLGAVEFDSRHFGWESERVVEYRQQLLEQMVSLTFEV